MFKKKLIYVVGIILVIIIIYFIFNNSTKKENLFYSGEIIVYKSPTCGCCTKYVSYLKSHGFNVKTVLMEDMDGIKQKYGVPNNLESCHTAIFGDYFVEGHVPIAAIEKMFIEKPAINGISLPAMPPGSPGMPGIKNGKFKIYSITDDGYEVFENI